MENSVGVENDMGKIMNRIRLFIIGIFITGCEPDTVLNGESNAFFAEPPATVCHQHLTAGIPNTADQLLCREGFALGYNFNTRLADWVAYYITAASVSATTPRADVFMEDLELPIEYRAILRNYAGSGYDRGHLAPAATVDFTKTSMEQSFLLSNIAPQRADFNRDGWAAIEAYVRDCAIDKGELYVVTGPIFTSQPIIMLDENVAVPDAYYTVILDPSGKAAFAFHVPHQAIAATDIAKFITSIDSVEDATGLDFFSAVHATIESIMESEVIDFCIQSDRT